MAKGEPSSVRFSSLTEEAMRPRRFPGIAFRGEGARRGPWVIGTGLDVWEICQLVDEFESVDGLVVETQLVPRQVQLALAYRDWYPDEIEAAIAENRRPVEEWLELYPFVRAPTASA